MSSVITIAFENWKAQEAATGKPVLLNEFVFANVPGLDATKPIDRNETLPPANQIVYRQAVNKTGLASENAVAYSVTLGAEVGDFDFNWIGLLNKESGTITMITHAPTQKKLKTTNGQQGNVLTRSFLLEFAGAAKETQITTTAETWQIDFTARLSGIDEMQRLINTDSYGEAAFFDDGFEVTRSAEQFTVKKGLAYVGGLRGLLEQNQILNNLRNTKVYADFSYQGNIVSQWRTVIKITAAAALNNYVDAAGFSHQVFAVASIDASGNVKDLRPMGALSDQELAALETRFKLDLSKKIDKASITHQIGNSTELVVSQQLLATELGKKQAAGNYAPAGDYVTNTVFINGLATKFDKVGGSLTGYLAAQKEVSSNFDGALLGMITSDKVRGPHFAARRETSGTVSRHNLPEKSGTLLQGGDYGIGTSTGATESNPGMLNIIDANAWNYTGFVASGGDGVNFFGAYAPMLSMIRSGGSDGTGFATQIQGDGESRIGFRQRKLGIWKGWYEFFTTANTTKDNNGFLRTGTQTTLTTGNVVQSAGVSATNVMSQKATTDAISAIKTLGDGQKWTDVKSQRQSDVAYTNTTGRAIALSIATNGVINSGSISVYVDNVLCSHNFIGGNNNADFTRHAIGYAIIPTGSTYRVVASSLYMWAELR